MTTRARSKRYLSQAVFAKICSLATMAGTRSICILSFILFFIHIAAVSVSRVLLFWGFRNINSSIYYPFSVFFFQIKHLSKGDGKDQLICIESASELSLFCSARLVTIFPQLFNSTWCTFRWTEGHFRNQFRWVQFLHYECLQIILNPVIELLKSYYLHNIVLWEGEYLFVLH